MPDDIIEMYQHLSVLLMTNRCENRIVDHKLATTMLLPSPGGGQMKYTNRLRIFTKHKPAARCLHSLIIAVFIFQNNISDESIVFLWKFRGEKWTTIVTLNTRPQFYELFYHAKKDNASIWLVQTKEEFPLINQCLWLISSMYDFVNTRKFTWLTSYHCNHRAMADDWILRVRFDQSVSHCLLRKKECDFSD